MLYAPLTPPHPLCPEKSSSSFVVGEAHILTRREGDRSFVWINDVDAFWKMTPTGSSGALGGVLIQIDKYTFNESLTEQHADGPRTSLFFVGWMRGLLLLF